MDIDPKRALAEIASITRAAITNNALLGAEYSKSNEESTKEDAQRLFKVGMATDALAMLIVVEIATAETVSGLEKSLSEARQYISSPDLLKMFDKSVAVLLESLGGDYDEPTQ